MKLAAVSLMSAALSCNPALAETPAAISRLDEETAVVDDRHTRIFVVHDDRRFVTCWVLFGSGSIACIPDWMLKEDCKHAP